MQNKAWTPSSWRGLPIKQQPEYEDQEALRKTLRTLEALPPLIFEGEIDALKQYLAECGDGRRLLLQGGDCAERFADCRREPIENKLKILMQMSVVLTWGARTPVVRIARIAGQYAKPRSKPTEVIDGVEVPIFRGDIVNGFEATMGARRSDPQRLQQAYFYSAATLNYLRAMSEGGFADLHHPETWNADFVQNASQRAEYEHMVDNIVDALDFLRQGTGASDDSNLRKVDLFSSHEGLLLDYEESMTTKRYSGSYFNKGAHFLWIGDRTRQLDGAHIEYFSGIDNPVGVKVGPSMDPDELQELVQRLHPNREKGKITLITRFGSKNVEEKFPSICEAVRESNLPVVWTCDPMHGNTEQTEQGLKTRQFDNILGELTKTMDIHETCGTHFGGVHFELTGNNVTECVGGPQDLVPSDLPRYYETYCDPRLNYSQSMYMAFEIAKKYSTRRSNQRRGRRS